MALPYMLTAAGRPRSIPEKMKPVAMSAKATGIPVRNRANMTTMPRMPSVTVLMPAMRWEENSHATRTGTTARKHARTASFGEFRVVFAIALITSQSNVRSRVKKPKATK